MYTRFSDKWFSEGLSNLEVLSRMANTFSELAIGYGKFVNVIITFFQ